MKTAKRTLTDLFEPRPRLDRPAGDLLREIRTMDDDALSKFLAQLQSVLQSRLAARRREFTR